MELLKSLQRKSLSLLFVLLLVPVSAMAEQELSTTTSQEAVQSTPPKTVTMDYNTYKTLKQNSNEALTILKVSNLTLTEAQNTMVEQEKLLNELKETNNQQALELTKAKETSKKQLESLKKTEESLNRSIESYKTLQHKYKVKKRQNRTIAILSGVAIVGVVCLASK